MNKNLKAAVVLTIHDAPGMSVGGRRSISGWLRRQATLLVKDGSNLSKRYTARYLYFADLTRDHPYKGGKK